MVAETIWKRYASAERQFDGERWWAQPVEPLVTTSLGADGSLAPSLVTRLYRQHVDEVVRRVSLDDGSTVTVTVAHRLLRPDGWTSDIRVGDGVAVPRQLKWTGARIDHNVIELLAWQIAEGYEP